MSKPPRTNISFMQKGKEMCLNLHDRVCGDFPNPDRCNEPTCEYFALKIPGLKQLFLTYIKELVGEEEKLYEYEPKGWMLNGRNQLRQEILKSAEEELM